MDPPDEDLPHHDLFDSSPLSFSLLLSGKSLRFWGPIETVSHAGKHSLPFLGVIVIPIFLSKSIFTRSLNLSVLLFCQFFLLPQNFLQVLQAKAETFVVWKERKKT